MDELKSELIKTGHPIVIASPSKENDGINDILESVAKIEVTFNREKENPLESIIYKNFNMIPPLKYILTQPKICLKLVGLLLKKEKHPALLYPFILKNTSLLKETKFDILALMIDNGANPVEGLNESFRTLEYDPDLIKFFIEKKAGVNHGAVLKPLNEICLRHPNDFDMIKYLIEKRAFVNTRDTYGGGVTPLYHLINSRVKERFFSCGFESIKYLLDNKSDPNIRVRCYPFSPLELSLIYLDSHLEITTSNHELIDLLIEHKSDINVLPLNTKRNLIGIISKSNRVGTFLKLLIGGNVDTVLYNWLDVEIKSGRKVNNDMVVLLRDFKQGIIWDYRRHQYFPETFKLNVKYFLFSLKFIEKRSCFRLYKPLQKMIIQMLVNKIINH